MGETTGIGWTNSTHNHFIGCEKVSPGCDNCYAEAYDKRVGGAPKAERAEIAERSGLSYVDGDPLLRWGAGAPRTLTSEANRKKPLLWNARAGSVRMAAELAGKPPPPRHRVFCSSLSDVFDPAVPDGWRTDLLDLIRRTPELDWQLLTKRPQLVLKLIGRAMCAVKGTCDRFDETICWAGDWLGGKAPHNVWIGATIEDRTREVRADHLRRIPAVVRFISAEPLLERIAPSLDGIDWVICGGESGGRARRFDLKWARDLREHCDAMGVAFFMKQLGSVPVDEGKRYVSKGTHGDDPRVFPPELQVQQFPTPRTPRAAA